MQNPDSIQNKKILLFASDIRNSHSCQYQMKDMPRRISYGRLFTKFLYREIFVILFFYAAPLLFQVDAVKEQVKAKCSVFDLSDDCSLECAWF